MGIAMNTVVGRRYQIHELVGGGAVSEVFRALDLERDQPVALKVLDAPQGTKWPSAGSSRRPGS